MACFRLIKAIRIFCIVAFASNSLIAIASDSFYSANESVNFQDTVTTLNQIYQQSLGYNKKGELDYVSSFLFLQSVNPKKLDSLAKGVYYDKLSIFYSYLGESSLASQSYDSTIVYQPYYSEYKTSKNDTAFLNKLKLVDAHSELITAAAKSRIFIIGEEHYSPHTRVFTASLLEDLYKQGYRNLALETLSYKVRFPANEKLNIKLSSGFYVLEPEMANLIRYAHKLGFNVIGYDCGGDCRSLQEREDVSASRLSKVFKNDSTAKMVIHVGYGHGMKYSPPGLLRALGKVIWDSTGIEPVSVAQHEISEGYIPSFKNYAYQYLKPKIKGPSIIYMGSKPLDLSGLHMFDFSMITNSNNHYFQEEMDKRIGLKRFNIKLSKKELQDGFLLQILPLEEAETYGSEHVVPSYQRLIKDKQEFVGSLSPGKYLVLVRDRNNTIISSRSNMEIR